MRRTGQNSNQLQLVYFQSFEKLRGFLARGASEGNGTGNEGMAQSAKLRHKSLGASEGEASMGTRRARYALIAICIATTLALAWNLWCGFYIPEYHRAYGIGVQTEMRAIAVALYEGQSSAAGPALGMTRYWGALTPALLHSIGIAPEMAIDPYNRSAPKSLWRTNPDVIADSAIWIRLRGGDLQFYSDGKGFWVIISRGPDRDLDLSQSILDSAATHWKLENGSPSFDADLLIPYSYDPSNGTVSSGDIWRVPD